MNTQTASIYMIHRRMSPVWPCAGCPKNKGTDCPWVVVKEGRVMVEANHHWPVWAEPWLRVVSHPLWGKEPWRDFLVMYTNICTCAACSHYLYYLSPLYSPKVYHIMHTASSLSVLLGCCLYCVYSCCSRGFQTGEFYFTASLQGTQEQYNAALHFILASSLQPMYRGGGGGGGWWGGKRGIPPRN